jgi:hypothetical protein
MEEQIGNTINFLVNYVLDFIFIDFINASSFVKSDEKAFELLDRFIEQIEENTIVQVINNNRSNDMLAGK